MEAKKKALIEALMENMGSITKATSQCGISRATYYEWMKDEEFKNHAENIDEYILDEVEGSLLKQIKEGNTTATIFYLKTKGVNRGYLERKDITSGGEKITNNIISLGNGINPADETPT
jgi:DNA-binding protein Fis